MISAEQLHALNLMKNTEKHRAYLIDDRGFRCLNARERWESDLAFVHNYDKMRQKYVGEVIILNKDFYLVEE